MTFASKLKTLTTLFDDTDTDTDINDVTSVEKSLVYWYGGSGYSYAIDGTNILDLGPFPPSDMTADDGNKKHAPFALIISKSGDKYSYNENISVELAGENDTLVDLQSRAISLAEDNKNTVRSVSVCKYTGKLFAGRPVYEVQSKYVYMSKSDIEIGVHMSAEDSIFETLEKAGTQAQSIIFPKDKYSVNQAKSWLSAHGKHSTKVDTTDNYHRFRQFDPSECSTTPKTISMGGSGIKAIICTKKSADSTDNADISVENASATINDLPDSDFAYIEPGGSKDKDGKTVPRSLRHFPIHDAAHVRNALARANQSPFGNKAMPKIVAAAKKFGIKMSNIEKEVPIKKYNLKKGLVYGVVYEPDEVDTHGHHTSAEEIENACHTFLPSALKNGSNAWTDKNHTDEIKGDVEVVESYIAPCDFEISGEKIKKGSWLLVSHVTDTELLSSIEKGEITGYSLAGSALIV